MMSGFSALRRHAAVPQPGYPNGKHVWQSSLHLMRLSEPLGHLSDRITECEAK